MILHSSMVHTTETTPSIVGSGLASLPLPGTNDVVGSGVLDKSVRRVLANGT